MSKNSSSEIVYNSTVSRSEQPAAQLKYNLNIYEYKYNSFSSTQTYSYT